MIGEILNHLWQSTLFTLLIGAATLAFRNNRANIRFGLWFAASLKFLVPFSVFVSLGEGLRGEAAAISIIAPSWGVVAAPASVAPAGMMTVFLLLVWACGAGLLTLRWGREWLRIRRALAGSRPLPHHGPLPVRVTAARVGPGLFGILRPALILPEEALVRLSADQLASVIEHENCHWRRRDNLTALVQMMVELLFWFHPLIWWLGARLLTARESACDEAVIAAGRDRETYAQSILEICKFELAHSLPCSPGVSGGDLKIRIARIMESVSMTRVRPAQKLLLTGLAAAAVIGPVLAGFCFAPRALANNPDVIAPVIQAAYCKQPVYPEEERKNGVEGNVVLSLLVGTDGTVKDTKIKQSSGSSALDGAASEGLSKCRFAPAHSAVGRVPVEAWAPFRYDWRVEK